MREPLLSSPDLAHETGLHIGDGNLTGPPDHDYRYVLSGDRHKECDFYLGTVSSLLKTLYSVAPSIYFHRNSVYALVYSKELVLFKSRVLGLPIGPKSQMGHLPHAVVSRGKACVSNLISGLYDADGSPKVRKTASRWYPRISFAQKTRAIVSDVQDLMSTNFGITSTIYRNDYYDKRTSVLEKRWYLDINGFNNVAKFSSCIGSRHPGVSAALEKLCSLRSNL